MKIFTRIIMSPGNKNKNKTTDIVTITETMDQTSMQQVPGNGKQLLIVAVFSWLGVANGLEKMVL